MLVSKKTINLDTMAAIPSVELSVITITYNEKENIRLFIEAVNSIFTEHHLFGEIIVVDDNSPDGTAAVVENLQKTYPQTTLIKRSGKLGIGSAYFTGTQAAQGRIIALLDADLSHPPAILPQLYSLAQENKISWGSRYLGATSFETDFTHRMGTSLLNGWVRFWLRTGMRDHTNGYLVLPKEILSAVLAYGETKNLHPFAHILYGITIAGIAKKLQIPSLEIKAPYKRRKHGETKIPFLWGVKVVFEDMAYTIKVFLKLR
ncbi:MAG: glycosyltransferase family 2 protein [Nanoarchaeota archaeon]|nr:glycosyltransferase family 2 protein [Nanoarchaeota archaeon]